MERVKLSTGSDAVAGLQERVSGRSPHGSGTQNVSRDGTGQMSTGSKTAAALQELKMAFTFIFIVDDLRDGHGTVEGARRKEGGCSSCPS